MAPSAVETPRLARFQEPPSPRSPRSTNAVNDYLRKLSAELSIPSICPPQDGIEIGNRDSDVAACRATIAMLYWQNKAALEDCVHSFANLPTEHRQLSKLRVLLKVLRDDTIKSPSFRASPRTTCHIDVNSFDTTGTAETKSFDTKQSKYNDSRSTLITTGSGVDETGTCRVNIKCRLG